ncbi:SDR family NAD(P)-dependent oxidoreductase [Streptomyces harbinensis]|uniref:SDR family oxidoreductase n=1 Tax=Streptomyces harbinensis TaxID=1176198 RepID=UPI0015923818|nr:SDR family oxidoreductase [Streptomyces harbinensis]QKV67839.1 SDR family NAD(P)-dependent oxidoreductase [Streptomyces harbinensis]
MRTRNNVVVITGASSGVGRACAQRFAARGWTVVLAGRRAAELEEVARRCRRRRRARALAVPTDVTDPTAVDELARRALAEYGRIDMWVNSAAVAAFGPLESVPPAVVRGVLDTGVLGYVHGARAALAAMRAQGSGTLVNISSAVGAAPVPYNSAYVMAKSAVRALGGSLRQELRLSGHRDIHVCTVLPATLDTPFFGNAANYSGRAVRPLSPVYTPERAARRIVRLARTPRREVYVGPAARALAVLSALVPATTERFLARQMDRHHLSRTVAAPDTRGNVFDPPAGAARHGGWHGRRRTALRRLTTAVLLTTLVLTAGRALRPPGGAAGRMPAAAGRRRCATRHRRGPWSAG